MQEEPPAPSEKSDCPALLQHQVCSKSSASLRSPNQVARSSSVAAEHLEGDNSAIAELPRDEKKRPAADLPSPPPCKFIRTTTGELIVVEEKRPSFAWKEHLESMEKKKSLDKIRRIPRSGNLDTYMVGSKEAQDQDLDESLQLKPPARKDLADEDLCPNPLSINFEASPPSAEDLERQEREELDHAVALSLQEQFNVASLISTSQGRAWDFVYKVAANHNALCQYDASKPDWNGNNFKVAPTDDLVFCMARVLDLQAEFRAAGKNCFIDIGFHYTTAMNMLRIRQDGLLTKAERDNANIEVESLGASFGDGIYTGNNPYSYHQFCGGDQGLLVARLKGSTEGPDPDMVVGRKGDTDEVCVLQKSSQCAVLVQFHADLVSTISDNFIGNQMVHAYHCSLQAIVDECFNDGATIEVPKMVPSGVTLRVHASQTTANTGSALQSYRHPQLTNLISLLTYEAPETLPAETLLQQVQDVDNANEQQCHICLDSMSQSGARCALLKKCSHQFHRACIEECLKYSYTCPVCRSMIASNAIQGSMPSGIMRIEGCPFLDCTGFPQQGSLRMTYEMQEGVQKAYHVNPGVRYDGTIRIAYLPDTEEGRALLKRLRYAFEHGLTFTVGTSLSTGQPNRIVWASIHHKTSTASGPHGFPDLGYFFNVNEELDALHVPSADRLDSAA